MAYQTPRIMLKPSLKKTISDSTSPIAGGYLMPKPYLWKDCSDAVSPLTGRIRVLKPFPRVLIRKRIIIVRVGIELAHFGTVDKYVSLYTNETNTEIVLKLRVFLI